MATTDAGQIANALPPATRTPRTRRGAASTAERDARREAELGASGTENMLGVISSIETLPALIPPDGLRVYEEMRNLAQVNASLYIVKAPILSSTPVVRPPKNGDLVDQGIADFCQAALFGPGGMRLSWRRVFEHLMTRLDYGVAVCEKVHRYDLESGTWRVAKLAPRLARTIWQWNPDPATNELASITQQAYRADMSYKQVTLPAQKCVVSTHQREGDNYWGRSILRPAYFHWWAITEMLRIGVVRADRWGVGIPKAKFTTQEDWTNRTLVAQVKRALKALRSHDRAYVMEHPGVEFSMLELNGTDGGVKLTDDIDFHARMIIQNVLATFLSGQSDGMSTNRTSKLADIFSSVLELVAGDIAEDLDEQVLHELCDLNFVMQGRAYPHIEFTNIADTDLEALANQVGRLYAIGALTPTPDDESFFREQYKLPPRLEGDVPEDDAADGEDDDPGAVPGPGRPKNARPPASAGEDGEDDDEADQPALRLKGDTGVLLGRAPTAVEVFCLREPEAYARTLNATAITLERRLAEIRRVQFDRLAAAIAKKDARTSTGAFTDLRPDNFVIPERGLARRAIRETQIEAFADGRRKVRQELARQGSAVSLRLTSDAHEADILQLAKKKPQPTQPTTASTAKSAIATSAAVSAERLNDLWFNRILEVATRLRRTGITGQKLVAEMWTALENELSAGLRGVARAEVNEAFGLGRGVEAQVQSDEIEKAVWSCLLDVAACDPCVQRDGIEATLDSEEYTAHPVPYAGCEGNKGGGDACRCQWLFLLKGRTV